MCLSVPLSLCLCLSLSLSLSVCLSLSRSRARPCVCVCVCVCVVHQEIVYQRHRFPWQKKENIVKMIILNKRIVSYTLFQPATIYVLTSTVFVLCSKYAAKKPVCAPHIPRGFLGVGFDWPACGNPIASFSGKIVGPFLRLCPSGDPWRDVWGTMAAGNVSWLPQIFRQPLKGTGLLSSGEENFCLFRTRFCYFSHCFCVFCLFVCLFFPSVPAKKTFFLFRTIFFYFSRCFCVAFFLLLSFVG